jgi:hypothetical protein
MLFNSFAFIFAFLPVVLIAFFLAGRFAGRTAAIGFLILASMFFYAWSNPIYRAGLLRLHRRPLARLPELRVRGRLHGGFVACFRMLRAMAPDLESVPSLRGLVRPVGELDGLIAANSGRTTLRDAAWSGSEVDFLGLGCQK